MAALKSVAETKPASYGGAETKHRTTYPTGEPAEPHVPTPEEVVWETVPEDAYIPRAQSEHDRKAKARRLEELQAEQEQSDGVLKATSDLARLTGIYYGTLKALGLPSDVIKVLTRDYARLTLNHYYGATGETLEE